MVGMSSVQPPRYRRFLAPAEFDEIEGFVRDAVAKKDDFDSAIGDYDFKNKIQCGLHSCHTWHQTGYVVRMRDARITNVGNKCGEIFGDEFKRARDAIDLAREREAIDATLALYRTKIDDYEERIRQLRNGPLSVFGLDETLKCFRNAFPAYEALHQRAQRNDPAIRKTRRRTEDEIEALRATAQGLSEDAIAYEEVLVGTLEGLKVLTSDGAKEVRERVIVPLDRLRHMRDDLTFLERKTLSKKLGEMDAVLVEADALQRAARAFFSEHNFATLRLLPVPGDQARALRQFRWDHRRHRPAGDR